MAPRAAECHVAGRSRPRDEICRLGNVDSFFFMFEFTKPKREALVVVRLPTDADIRAGMISGDSRDYYSASSARLIHAHFNTR
jgi:hypothetical protein